MWSLSDHKSFVCLNELKIMHVVEMQIENRDVFLTSAQFEGSENLYDLIDMWEIPCDQMGLNFLRAWHDLREFK